MKTNTAVVSLLAIIILLATAVWRVVTGRSQNGYRLIWATGLVSIGLALLTDLDTGLGAGAAAVVLVFFIINSVKTKAGTWTAPQPNSGGAAAPASPGAIPKGGAGQTTCPPGCVGDAQGYCFCPPARQG